MKTDVRLLSLRSLLLLEASLLQHARLILSQVTPSRSYPNNSAETITSTPLATNLTCAPCTVSVQETVLSFPVPVNETTQTATATVIPYITEYPDGTNITSYSTYSAYAVNASSNANFTAPTSKPLIWTTLGFTLTYPTTYIAFPSPEAGINSVYVVDSVSYCYATNLTIIPDIPTHSLLFPYNDPTTTPTTVQESSADNASSNPTVAPVSSVGPPNLATVTSSLLSYLDTLPQLSSIVSTNPRLCSQTVALSFALASGASSLATSAVPTAPVQHTSVAVLTETGQAVVSAVLSDNGEHPTGGGGGSNTEGSSPPPPSGGGGNSIGPGVGAPTAVTTAGGGGTGQFITVGPTSFLVSAAQSGGSGAVVIGGSYATLAPGSTIAINGVPISYELSGSTTALVVSGSTIPLGVTTANAGAGNGVLTVGSSTITAGPNGAFVISGQTLYPGQQITIGGSTVSGHVNGGTTISLAAGGSSAVINGQTETLRTATSSGGTGSAVTSGIGVMQSNNAASKSIKGHDGNLNGLVYLIALVFGVLGALTIAL